MLPDEQSRMLHTFGRAGDTVPALNCVIGRRVEGDDVVDRVSLCAGERAEQLPLLSGGIANAGVLMGMSGHSSYLRSAKLIFSACFVIYPDDSQHKLPTDTMLS